MDYDKFYSELYAPLVPALGPVDKDTIVAIVGFDLGGPLNFCTFGRDSNHPIVTYVSCELAVRKAQKPNSFGRYELLTTCDSEQWVRSVLSDTGRMTLDVVFDDGHTMDIGDWVKESGWFKSTPSLQGLLFKKECAVTIKGKPYGILRCVGITRAEMAFALKQGASELVARLTDAGIYPHTLVGRKSVI